jgi:hypothetical protein
MQSDTLVTHSLFQQESFSAYRSVSTESSQYVNKCIQYKTLQQISNITHKQQFDHGESASSTYLSLQAYCTLGWVDIGTRTKVPLKFVTYLSKITKINEKSVLTQ